MPGGMGAAPCMLNLWPHASLIMGRTTATTITIPVQVTALGREVLGGNGILADFNVAKVGVGPRCPACIRGVPTVRSLTCAGCGAT